MKIVATIEATIELGERDIYEGMTLAEAVDSEINSISIEHAAGIERIVGYVDECVAQSLRV